MNELRIAHNARELVWLDRELAELVYALLVDADREEIRRMSVYLDALKEAIDTASPPPGSESW